tara:strand:+ start:7564 stop:7767 length:204 start_codon:yes stop_codon:yes gene_type:complete
MARTRRISGTHDVRTPGPSAGIPPTRRREISTFAADCHYSPFFTFALAARRIPPFPEPESRPTCEGM